MDEIDGRLIELFATEPRLGVLEASRRLGIARGTVQARLDKLAAAGVITGWGPDLSPEAIGYPVTAFLTLEIRQGRGGHDAVAAHLAGIPEVLEAYTITGAGDMWARVVARSNADLQRVIDLVLTEPGIDRSTTVIALATQIPYRVVPLARAAVERPLSPRPHDQAGRRRVGDQPAGAVSQLRLRERRAPSALDHRALAGQQARVDGDRAQELHRQVERGVGSPDRQRGVHRAGGGGVEQRRDDAAVHAAERVVVELRGRHLDDDAALLGARSGDAEGVHDRRGRQPPSTHRLQLLQSVSRPQRAPVDLARVGQAKVRDCGRRTAGSASWIQPGTALAESVNET